jgi:diadenosine tetraphosphate (Ap4A) HIT family hydrolase
MHSTRSQHGRLQILASDRKPAQRHDKTFPLDRPQATIGVVILDTGRTIGRTMAATVTMYLITQRRLCRAPLAGNGLQQVPRRTVIRDTLLMDCLLCQIVARTEDASIVYEDDRVLALCDLYPVNPGHLLVVTKTHALGLTDLDEADGRQMFTIGQALAAAIRKADLRCDGINLFLADGAAAFQEVFHVHLHVIPRYVGDSFRLCTGQSTTPTPRSNLDAIASQLRALL